MGVKLSPTELLKAVAASGYFETGTFDPGLLCLLIENKLNLGRRRAIALLVEGGFVTFEYEQAENLNPRDSLDRWRLVLTEIGKSSLGVHYL